MKNKTTKIKNEKVNVPLTIICIILLVIFIIIPSYFMVKSEVLIIKFGCFLLVLYMIIGLISVISGKIKGRLQIRKENRYIKNTNPYIYYRELPNNYGVGITSLLIDSQIENYKDIVAVILDLCAKKYINLIKEDNKYNIKVLKDIDDNLLSNEKYILTLLKNNDIKNINYQEWYNYCMQDGMDLGLYYRKEIKFNFETPLTENIIKKNRRRHLTISLVIGILVFLIFLASNVVEGIKMGIFFFIVTYVVLIIPFYLINVVTGFINIGKQTAKFNYKNVIEKNLTKTEKGIEELHKLYSYKAFIKEFGSFVDKNPEEVMLWDRYLSYAQVFGLTKNIMNTGYKELVENASFKIDSIDNINLENIEIK